MAALKEISTEIIIPASPESVWQVLSDFENYRNWNSYMRSVQGKAVRKGRLTILMELPNGRTFYAKPKLTKVDAPTEMRWLGHLYFPGLFDVEHFFLLEALDNGKTRLVQGETFKGLMSGPILKNIEADLRAAFIAMNKALKKKVLSAAN